MPEREVAEFRIRLEDGDDANKEKNGKERIFPARRGRWERSRISSSLLCPKLGGTED
jgi:hypothetical protein